jgi:hypothetical protein
VTFIATVRPQPATAARPAVTFVVYRRVGTVWVLFRRQDIAADASGRAVMAWRFSKAGSWYVRSMALATALNTASAWSAIAQYKIK